MAAPTRWAPWIDAGASCLFATTVNSTSPVAISGVSLTVTPHVNTRALPMITGDVECTTFAASSILVLRATISPSASPGTPNPAQLLYLPTGTGQRLVLAQMCRPWDLLKETTYTIALEGLLAGVGGASYRVQATHTRLQLIGLPNLHA